MEIHNVEQNSPEWFALRAGIPTASEFKRLITSQGRPSKSAQDYAYELAAELYAGAQLEKWEGNQWTQRGHELEDEARSSYEFLREIDVQRIGFVTNHGAGCSPDGLVDDDGLVEIKCLAPKNHVAAIAYVAKTGKCPPDYIPQAQGQSLLCDRAWCDVLFYHPALPHLVVRVEADAEFHSTLLDLIQDVIEERNRLVDLLRAA